MKSKTEDKAYLKILDQEELASLADEQIVKHSKNNDYFYFRIVRGRLDSIDWIVSETTLESSKGKYDYFEFINSKELTTQFYKEIDSMSKPVNKKMFAEVGYFTLVSCKNHSSSLTLKNYKAPLYNLTPLQLEEFREIAKRTLPRNLSKNANLFKTQINKLLRLNVNLASLNQIEKLIQQHKSLFFTYCHSDDGIWRYLTLQIPLWKKLGIREIFLERDKDTYTGARMLVENKLLYRAIQLKIISRYQFLITLEKYGIKYRPIVPDQEDYSRQVGFWGIASRIHKDLAIAENIKNITENTNYPIICVFGYLHGHIATKLGGRPAIHLTSNPKKCSAVETIPSLLPYKIARLPVRKTIRTEISNISPPQKIYNAYLNYLDKISLIMYAPPKNNYSNYKILFFLALVIIIPIAIFYKFNTSHTEGPSMPNSDIIKPTL